ncbi:MAG: hypothetical protein JO257_04785 [Deltaproteobacteria bacterium]|nr:hypothetical protein [Deltaproteobacteria bacterium]
MIKTLVLAAALFGCKHKPADATAGSGSAVEATGSAVAVTPGSAGSAVADSPGSAAMAGSATGSATMAGSAAGSAAVAEDAGPPAKQPKRSAKDAAAFKLVDDALADATKKARAAKTTKDACAPIDGLSKATGGLEKVTPPKGLEHEFAEARDGLGMQIDHIVTVTCPDAQAQPDEVVDGLVNVRGKLSALESIGAK